MSYRALIIAPILLGTIALGWVFYEKQTEINSYRQDVTSLEAKQDLVNQEIESFQRLLSLKDDNEYIEYLARKELGLIYPGEEKYIIVGGD